MGNTVRAQALLATNQSRYDQNQLLLTQQLAEYQELQDKLATDPQVQQDAALATAIQTQMAELGVTINNTRDQITSLEEEIAWLTPLTETGSLITHLTIKNMS